MKCLVNPAFISIALEMYAFLFINYCFSITRFVVFIVISLYYSNIYIYLEIHINY